MKGFKDTQGNFHPTENKIGVRKSIDKTTKTTGIKLNPIKRKSRGIDLPINNISKEEIININKEVLQDPQIIDPSNIEPFAVREEINQVIDIIDKVGKTDNREENLIEKASYMMASISWLQPFVGGNKRTAFISTQKFLEDNGYSFSVKSKEEKYELIRLLNEIQNNRSELDIETLQEIIFYIRKRIKKHG